MDRAKVIEAIKQVKASEVKRNFEQSIDLIINLKEIDINKDEGKLEEFVVLPAGRAKQAKVCALVGPELQEQAKKFCDLVILSDEFPKWDDKRKLRKLARQYNFFIGQANIMPQIAKSFGRYFGPLGKMPNPKAGHVVPLKANIETLVKNLKSTVKVAIKKSPVIQCSIGSEKMTDENLADNVVAVIEKVQSKLPNAQHNIKNVVIKKTMSKGVKVA